MDEAAFGGARGVMNPQPCAFEKALLARCCACSLAERRNIAEREAVACASPGAREQCAALRGLLRQKSAFALKLTQAEGQLPHALEMKLQCGGLQGVRQAAAAVAAAAGAEENSSVDPQALSRQAGSRPAVDDVQELVRACAETFGGLENLPYSTIVQSVAAWQIRRRSSKT
ncbi:MAG: hypothetical protein WC830_23685 [Burkholderiales bacterium]|jgi:hypothetical protein